MAKTRLRRSLIHHGYDWGANPAAINQLCLAMAADCVNALRQCPHVSQVWVVSSDPAAQQLAQNLGATALSEPQPNAGLLPALRHAIAQLPQTSDASSQISQQQPVAIVLGDVPCLRSQDAAEALMQTWQVLSGATTAAGNDGMAVVPDHHGQGTTFAAALQVPALQPRFGAHSRAAHREAGAVELGAAPPAMRLDVDTATDLAQAVTVGIGASTQRVLRAYGYPLD